MTLRNNNHGFSLIELLVVIAIISMLLAVLLPSMSRVREAGRRAVCGSQLRQVHLIAATLGEDNRGRYPILDADQHLAPARNWHMPNFIYNRKLRDELAKLSDAIHFCPSNPSREWHHANGYRTGLTYATAYGMYFGRQWPQYEDQVGDYIPELQMSSSRAGDIFAGDMVRHWMGRWVRPPSSIPSPINGDRLRINNHIGPGGMVAGGNIGWADGSVRWIDWNQMDHDIFYKNVYWGVKGQDWDFYLGVSR